MIHDAVMTEEGTLTCPRHTDVRVSEDPGVCTPIAAATISSAATCERGITPVIARRGVQHGSGPDGIRRVVE
ncbi:hypothetical protein ACFSKW_46110 [Nonomuraea mangrovi]|uniref:Uncharacterized protein n=1 Tax=Nonomuraea mangrovi TaxID=2316207 RepID=A0ABW4TC35_9ACTN